MNLHPVTIEGVQQTAESNAPLLVLRDDLGRVLKSPSASARGWPSRKPSINNRPGRPLTHDLMLILAEHLEVSPLPRGHR